MQFSIPGKGQEARGQLFHGMLTLDRCLMMIRIALIKGGQRAGNSHSGRPETLQVAGGKEREQLLHPGQLRLDYLDEQGSLFHRVPQGLEKETGEQGKGLRPLCGADNDVLFFRQKLRSWGMSRDQFR